MHHNVIKEINKNLSLLFFYRYVNIEFEIYINTSRPKDLELNSPNMSERKPINDIERISSLTNFSPNKR